MLPPSQAFRKMPDAKQPAAAIIWYKALAELKAEASRAYVGVLWWVIEPLLYMTVFYIVFAVGFRAGGSDFLAFLLVALVPWKWFQATIQAGTNVIVANQGLISQVYFPKYILIGMILVSNSIKFCVILVLLFIFLPAMGVSPSVNWLWAVPACLSLMLLMTGVASITACITPYMPDIRLIVDNGLLLAFFMSGIFFDIASRSPEAQNILYLNPVAGWIEEFRTIMINGQSPDLLRLLNVAILGVVLAIVGFWTMSRLDRKFAKVAL
jgi:lipopolysaccharide transport system permease protein